MYMVIRVMTFHVAELIAGVMFSNTYCQFGRPCMSMCITVISCLSPLTGCVGNFQQHWLWCIPLYRDTGLSCPKCFVSCLQLWTIVSAVLYVECTYIHIVATSQNLLAYNSETFGTFPSTKESCFHHCFPKFAGLSAIAIDLPNMSQP